VIIALLVNDFYMTESKDNLNQTHNKQLTIFQHIKKEPYIFAGCVATVGILLTGITAFFKGNSQLSQKMMRWRVGMQGVTVLMIVSSFGFGNFSAPARTRKLENNNKLDLTNSSTGKKD